MFNIFKNSFKGGNTLLPLAFFVVIGLLLHYKGNTEPLVQLWETVQGKNTESLDNYASDVRTPPIIPISKSKENPPSKNNETPIETSTTSDMASDDVSDLSRILARSNFHIPNSKNNLQLVNHSAYSLGYAERYEQAAWVSYLLTAERATGEAKREKIFRPDPKVKTNSAVFADYTGSGYDRGHLAPAADFRSSVVEMKETFFMSNISPQERMFNGGIWSELEKMVRVWAQRYDQIYVVTGPVLKPGLPTIGRVNKVAVPQKFYKVILFAKPPYVKAIGFLMDNKASQQPLSKFVVPISEIEELTGLEFFPQLPKDIQKKVKNTVNPKEWPRLK